MLCEGKTTPDIGSENFWKIRYEFLNKFYKITKRSFVDRTLKEYRSLCNHKSEDEIILWFEYDLFCQINMIAVLSWLKKHRKGVQVSLVTSGLQEGGDRYLGLSELTKEQLLNLYETRLELSQDDIEHADYVWQLYCSSNPLQLENVVQQPNTTQFEYLPLALEAHIKRFPTVRNGLNELENRFLRIAADQKPASKNALVGSMLKDQGVYGFGDLQFFKMAKDLKPLFHTFNPVRLSRLGKEVLKGETSFYPIIKDQEMYLGGTLKYDFLYHEDTGRLLKL